MICPKCSAANDGSDKFCFNCGALLSDESSARESAGESARASAAEAARRAEKKIESIISQSAKTMLAAREARKGDIASMRPFTRAAYNIVESERASTFISIISVLYVVLCLGMVATIIKIFETITKLSESIASSKIEGSLSQMFYGQTSTDNAQLLIWLVVLFAVLVVSFICFGKLKIRISKVARKKKKEQLDSRL